MNSETHDFEQRSRTLLRSAEQQLDAATLARLTAARSAALAVKPRRWPFFEARWLAGAAAAAVIGIAVLVAPQFSQQNSGSMDGSQLADNPDLYRDLDFYLWLSESEMGSRG